MGEHTCSRKPVQQGFRTRHVLSRLWAWARLFGGRALLPVLIYAESPDLRFERLPWNPEFRGGARWSGYPAMAVGKSGLDHLQFTIGQRRKPFVQPRRTRRFPFQPTLVDFEGVSLNEDDCAFDYVLQFADIAGPMIGP